MKLKIGPTRKFRASNTRGAAFHGMGAFVGVGKTQRAHVYSANTLPVGPDDYKKIDPKKLAEELEVDMCVVNHGRFWMMDELEVAAGDTVNFHGVDMNWVGDMTGAEMVAQFENAYLPCLIRRDTIWTFKAGKPVHLLREPGGPVWVLQEYTKAVDPSLTPDNLNAVGRQAEEPAERLEVRDQGAGQGPGAGYRPLRRLGGHHPRRPALHLSGLRLRQGHQRQLRAITRATRRMYTRR